MAPVRTSLTDPIRVDFVAPEAHGLPGRLGLTIAPGKSDATRSWNRDLKTDLRRLRDTFGTDVLVTLLEHFEMHRVSIPDLRKRAIAAGMESIGFPIADLCAPRSVEETRLQLIDPILERLAAGKTVVVHCMGGIGRSGTIAACCLVARGHAPARAIALVRAARPRAVETDAQEVFVARYHRGARDAGNAR